MKYTASRSQINNIIHEIGRGMHHHMQLTSLAFYQLLKLSDVPKSPLSREHAVGNINLNMQRYLAKEIPISLDLLKRLPQDGRYYLNHSRTGQFYLFAVDVAPPRKN